MGEFGKTQCFGDVCCRSTALAQLTLSLQRDGSVDEGFWFGTSRRLTRSGEGAGRTSEQLCAALHCSWGRSGLAEEALEVVVDDLAVSHLMRTRMAETEKSDEEISDRLEAAQRERR